MKLNDNGRKISKRAVEQKYKRDPKFKSGLV